jgi:restriction endonuclease S subunit
LTNLSGERYKIATPHNHLEFPLKKIIDVTEIKKGSSITKALVFEGNIPVIAGGQQPAYYHNESNRIGKTITVSSSGAYAGFINYFEQPIFASDCTTIQSDESLLKTKFLFHILKSKQDDFYKLQKGGAQPHVYGKDFGEIQIPLPPLSIQEEIVEEIEGYQKIIDGAKLVVQNYKPKIDVDPEWKMVELDKLLSEDKYSIKAGPFGSSIKKECYVEKGYKVYGQEQAIADDLSIGNYYIDEEKYQELKSCEIKSNDILISLVGTVGKVTIVPEEFQKGIINPRLIKITLDLNKMIPKYFKYYFRSESIIEQVNQQTGGLTMSVLNGRILKTLKFLVPPLETQKHIVEQIEREQELVNANKKLITIFEQKIKDRIAKVWGEEKPSVDVEGE